MEYVEVKYPVSPDNKELAEELMALLGDLGYESFVEDAEDLLSYIPLTHFDPSSLSEANNWPENIDITKFTWQVIPEQNWNALWEENFQPVTIAGRCHIRAPFHSPLTNVEYEIIIEPKMSFGTAHHETTALMIEHLLDTDCRDKKVLDMGCGTGILAILASHRGSKDVTAIDNDEWAYNNTLENIERNNTPTINVYLGDASLLKDQSFSLILANINRNILLQDIPAYAECLDTEGLLFLSGFYIEDLVFIIQAAENSGLKYISHKELNKWVAANFKKN